MLRDNIKIGDKVEINKKGEKALIKPFLSQVENITNDGNIILHMPIEFGRLVKLPLSNDYAIIFFTDKGMVVFTASITGYTKEDGFHLLIATLDSDGEKTQRREFFRFNCILPVKFSPIDHGKEFDVTDIGKYKEGVAKDIGGGGVRFVSSEDIEPKTKIQVIIMLGEELLIAKGKVLNKQFLNSQDYKYQYRIEYYGMLETEREKIVQFIFHEQRRLLRNKKI